MNSQCKKFHLSHPVHTLIVLGEGGDAKGSYNRTRSVRARTAAPTAAWQNERMRISTFTYRVSVYH